MERTTGRDETITCLSHCRVLCHGPDRSFDRSRCGLSFLVLGGNNEALLAQRGSRTLAAVSVRMFWMIHAAVIQHYNCICVLGKMYGFVHQPSICRASSAPE